MNKSLLFALAFVLTVASCAVLADKPPEVLMQYVAQQRLVHDQKCNFKEEKGVECLIYFDEAREVVWIILFDEKNGDMYITRVVMVKDKKEVLAWCRQDVCI